MTSSAFPAPRPTASAADRQPLLEVESLSVEFHTRSQTVRAVDDVTFAVEAGETVVVLGESGSGKSVTALTTMGLLDPPPAVVTTGAVRFRGTDLLTLGPRERRAYRGPKMAMIFQDALSALNPVYSVGSQIAEMIRAHTPASRSAAKARAVELMDRVRIPGAARRYGDYPHQFSGGMRQRIMIAMALALDPELLIADEPTTALDVTIQAQIMALLKDLQQEHGMALLLITHDLGVADQVADRIVVMYAGRVVESAAADALYRHPSHPYTEGLLASVPTATARVEHLTPIPGSPPNPTRLPSGCPFHPRCPRVQDICRTERPPLLRIGARVRAGVGGGSAYAPAGLPLDDQASACHFAEEVRGARV